MLRDASDGTSEDPAPVVKEVASHATLQLRGNGLGVHHPLLDEQHPANSNNNNISDKHVAVRAMTEENQK